MKRPTNREREQQLVRARSRPRTGSHENSDVYALLKVITELGDELLATRAYLGDAQYRAVVEAARESGTKNASWRTATADAIDERDEARRAVRQLVDLLIAHYDTVRDLPKPAMAVLSQLPDWAWPPDAPPLQNDLAIDDQTELEQLRQTIKQLRTRSAFEVLVSLRCRPISNDALADEVQALAFVLAGYRAEAGDGLPQRLILDLAQALSMQPPPPTESLP